MASKAATRGWVRHSGNDRTFRLTPEQREELVKLYATGAYTMTYVAEKFNVSTQAVRYHWQKAKK